jgi:glucose-1-phosphate cytidylyltransferase
MKVVILAGGKGTRLSEETADRPKPMVEIGGKPILWHIMKIYYNYGFDDFVICLGYKGYMIKEYFINYRIHNSNVFIDFVSGESFSNYTSEMWYLSLIDTGLETMTGGRLKRIQNIIGNETFMLTYGDGVSDINLKELLEHHKKQGRIATVTAVQPAGKFGALQLQDDAVSSFQEKPKGDGGYISGGFFVFEPAFFDYLKDDTTIMEQEPLVKLAKDGQLTVFRHHGFWQSMDTVHDKNLLESLWSTNKAPWKSW